VHHGCGHPGRLGGIKFSKIMGLLGVWWGMGTVKRYGWLMFVGGLQVFFAQFLGPSFGNDQSADARISEKIEKNVEKNAKKHKNKHRFTSFPMNSTILEESLL